jgi:hypothetical protein
MKQSKKVNKIQTGYLLKTDNYYIQIMNIHGSNFFDFKKYKFSTMKKKKFQESLLSLFEELRQDIANTEFCRFPRIWIP